MMEKAHDMIEIHRTSNNCHSYNDEVVVMWCKICGYVKIYIDHGDKLEEVLATLIPEGQLR